MTIPLGFIGVIWDDMERDVGQALNEAAAIGYRGIGLPQSLEFLGSSRGKELARAIHDSGLRILNWHLGDPAVLVTDADRVLETIAPLTPEYISVSHDGGSTLEKPDQEAALLNDAGERLSRAGITLCYHNHAHEMRNVEGKRALDHLLELTDPRFVQLELDVAWATLGAGDPASILRQYAGRVPLLQLEDVEGPLLTLQPRSSASEEARMTDCGSGIVDFRFLLAAAREAGVKWGIVEKERRPWHGAGMQALEKSYRHLTAVGWG